MRYTLTRSWKNRIIIYLVKKLKGLIHKQPTSWSARLRLSRSTLQPEFYTNLPPPTLTKRHLTSSSAQLHLSGAAVRPAFDTHWDMRLRISQSLSLTPFLPLTHPGPEASYLRECGAPSEQTCSATGLLYPPDLDPIRLHIFLSLPSFSHSPHTRPDPEAS